MTTFDFQPVIDILTALANNSEFDAGKIDEAIDALEMIKESIDISDDEAIDKVDEIQDCLQYLLAIKQPIMEEVKEELSQMISELQQ